MAAAQQPLLMRSLCAAKMRSLDGSRLEREDREVR
jgi:hypothetical protein